ncbi:hypothetical protein BBK82_07490 [Lentzea guizhouensis]|uniref:Uncharacterized protein n=1 Tax=Lentzea guizhouensis TaxID=1586287 RepID=A0A1B2HDZ6_9PSEU|nr:hypothetical protein BBK82_07490 [Lentzea guizhouensis]
MELARDEAESTSRPIWINAWRVCQSSSLRTALVPPMLAASGSPAGWRTSTESRQNWATGFSWCDQARDLVSAMSSVMPSVMPL